MPESPHTSPVLLGDFIQPRFPFARLFSVLVMDNALVFAKNGTGSPNAAGTLKSSLGGSTPTALIASALGRLWDSLTGQRRSRKTVQLASQRLQAIVAADPLNFCLPFDTVERIEFHGPNFAGEVNCIIHTGVVRKFRLDRQSEATTLNMVQTLSRCLGDKVVRT